jgi:hypothetical protein
MLNGVAAVLTQWDVAAISQNCLEVTEGNHEEPKQTESISRYCSPGLLKRNKGVSRRN